MLRSRLVFDRLKDFFCRTGRPNAAEPMDGRERPSEIDIVIPLSQKILQPIKSLSDLTQQLIRHPGQ